MGHLNYYKYNSVLELEFKWLEDLNMMRLCYNYVFLKEQPLRKADLLGEEICRVISR